MMNKISEDPVKLREIREKVSDAYQYHETRDVLVQMPFGTKQTVKTHWFKSTGKVGRRKTGPKPKDSNRKGKHLYLELYGFTDKVAPTLKAKALKYAALCPSNEIASNLLRDDGIIYSSNKMCKQIKEFAEFTNEERAELSCDENESLEGKRVLLCVDGGRYRRRKTKTGRIPASNKRHGYDLDWKEVKLFTIYVFGENGEVEKTYKPQIDGVIGEKENLIDLLHAYLKKLQIHKCKEVVFAADGATWQWKDIPALLLKLKVSKSKITPILDHMHARENLFEIIANCSKDALNVFHDELKEEASTLLYEGKIEELGVLISKTSNKGFKKSNYKKWKSYFLANKDRMQYEMFREKGFPIGSGAVESAIRRVVNLRIKSPCVFWTEEGAESMVFLRSKILYGRWGIVTHKLKKMNHNRLINSEI